MRGSRDFRQWVGVGPGSTSDNVFVLVLNLFYSFMEGFQLFPGVQTLISIVTYTTCILFRGASGTPIPDYGSTNDATSKVFPNYGNVKSWKNNLIKLTHYDETKKMAHNSQIVRAKENLKLCHRGSSLR